MAQAFVIKRFALTSTVWTPIIIPIESGYVVIENVDTGNAMSVRTDPDDGSTEKTIPAGMELEVKTRGESCPFQPGATFCHAKMASGTGPAVVSFIR
jgi:hypothetical protein